MSEIVEGNRPGSGLDAAISRRAELPRILLILPTFYPDIYGGAERQAKILSGALSRRGAHVTLLTPTVTSVSSEEKTDFGTVFRFRVTDYPNLGGKKIASTLSWVWQVVRWAWRHRNEFDVVYVFHARLHALAGLAAARVTGKPLLIKLGGSGESFELSFLRGKRGGYGRLAAALLANLTQGFVANSRSIVGDLEQFGVDGRRIFLFPNGVITPARSSVESSFAARSGQRFIFAGRLDNEKRVGVILDAFAYCRDAGLSAELTFVGLGPALEELKQRAAELNLLDRVHFPGRIDEIYPELSAHDFFVSASMREGQSNALLEAMATACIPIVANVSGASDVVVPGERGFIVDAPTPENFGQAMIGALRLSEVERRAIGLAAHDFVRKNLDIDLIAQRTLETAETLIARRASTRQQAASL